MSWFDRIFKKQTDKKLTWAHMLDGYTPIYSRFGENIYASDVVQQAIKCIVDEMKKLRPVHERESDGDTVPVTGDIQKVLNNPNPIMTKSDFIEKMMWILMLDFNAFAIPVYDVWHDEKGVEQRAYRAVYPVRPATVTFIEDAGGIIYIKMRFANNYETTLPYSDVVHLKYRYSVSEFMGGNEQGKPDHSALLKTLKINENMINGIDRAMRSSFAVNAVIKYNTMMDTANTEEALKELEGKLNRSESGFLPLDLKSEYIPLKKEIKMVDAETLKFIDEKILRNWGVSIPILTGDYTPQQYESFYQKTLEPIIMGMSDEYTRVFFTDRQRSYGNRIRFYPKNLIFMNMDQTLQMVRLLGDSGSLYENEKRIAFGMPPIPELKGKRMQSLNYVDVGIAEKYQLNGTGENKKEGGETDGSENTEDK